MRTQKGTYGAQWGSAPLVQFPKLYVTLSSQLALLKPCSTPRAEEPIVYPTEGNTEAQGGKLPVQDHTVREKAGGGAGLKPSWVTLLGGWVTITTVISEMQGQSCEQGGHSINAFPPPLSDFKAEMRLMLWSQMAWG